MKSIPNCCDSSISIPVSSCSCGSGSGSSSPGTGTVSTPCAAGCPPRAPSPQPSCHGFSTGVAPNAEYLPRPRDLKIQISEERNHLKYMVNPSQIRKLSTIKILSLDTRNWLEKGGTVVASRTSSPSLKAQLTPVVQHRRQAQRPALLICHSRYRRRRHLEQGRNPGRQNAALLYRKVVVDCLRQYLLRPIIMLSRTHICATET